MALAAGTRLGPYEITGALGAGGMGEVYRARDNRLGRDVAIKVLPASFAADAERLQRFEVEAQAAGRLNHPNVLTVYDVGAHPSTGSGQGAPYLVTELLEGETLRDRLKSATGTDLRAQTPLSVRKTLDIGRQVALGLAAAHTAGIVHRDLKPENVFLTTDGRAKILDFGLARMTERATGDPSIATALQVTDPGTVLGTVGYMSPEQVRGKAADARSDLFALGAMLFEMAGGRRAFERDSSADTMAAILKEDPPDLSASGMLVPPALDRLIRRCLEKNPDERFQSARDLAFAIEALDGSSSGSTTISGTAPVIADARQAARRLGWILAAAAIIVAAAGGYFVGRGHGTRAASGSSSTPALKLRQLTFGARSLSMPALSTDGANIAFVDNATGNQDIYVQRVGGESATNVTNSPAEDTMPVWSPDGLRIAFRSSRDGGGIFIMGSAGESVRRITTEGFNPAWSPDGKELAYSDQQVLSPFVRQSGATLWRVDTVTGAKTKVYDGDAVQPSWSPDGRLLVFWGLPSTSGHRAIWTIAATGGQPSLLVDTDAMNWNPVWSRDGQHVYFLSDREPPMNIWRIPVDPASGAARGSAERVTLGTANHSWLSQQSTSAAQPFVFASTTETNVLARRTIALSPDTIGPAQPILSTARSLTNGVLSKDGRTLAFTTADATEDLIVLKTDGTGLVRLTNDAFRDRAPYWSWDSSTVYFASDRSGAYELWRIRSDGSGLEQLTRRPNSGLYTIPAISPANRYVSVVIIEKGGTPSTGLFDLSVPVEQRKLRRLGPPEFPDASYPMGWLSDGRLVAYTVGDPKASAILLLRIGDKSPTRLPIPDLIPQFLIGDRFAVCTDTKGLPHLVDLATGATRLVSTGDIGPTETPIAVSADTRTLYSIRKDEVTNLWMIGK